MPPLRFNVPPLTRILCVSLIGFSLINATLRYRSWGQGNTYWGDTAFDTSYLHLVPPASIKYPWTFLTSSFVEQNMVSVICSTVILFYSGRYLERAWSSKSFARVILFVTVIPNIIAFLTVSLVVAGGVPLTISGTASLTAAFLVAFKQLVPEHTVSLFRNVIRIRVKHFPALYLLLWTVLIFVPVPPLALLPSAILAYSGFFVAWIYLRFYKSQPSLSTTADEGSGAGIIKGDASDTFAFAHFFPEPIHTPLAAIADAIYNIATSLRIIAPFTDTDVEAGNQKAAARAETGLPNIMTARGGGAGSSRAEAERRRALALKALDQRLQAGGRPNNPIPVVTAPDTTRVDGSAG